MSSRRLSAFPPLRRAPACCGARLWRCRQVGEEEFQELTFNVCDPDLDEGEWITMYDVVQHIPGSGNDEEDGGDLDEDSEEAVAAAAGSTAGGRIAVEKQEYVGECRRECRTIQRACNNVLEEYREDLAELLWKRTPDTLEKLSSRVCTKWAKVRGARAWASE